MDDQKEIEKCKSLAYFVEKYCRIKLPDGTTEAPSAYMIERCRLYDQGHSFPLITGSRRHVQWTQIKKAHLKHLKDE